MFILNPRDVGSSNLFEADADWIRDFNNHQDYLQYYVDYKKRPAHMK
jgi:hypothetical protein